MSKFNRMKKNGFTMIELVFVIVILGILASLAMGRMERDITQEASTSILSNIRLAQQMALNDNKTRPEDNNWHTKMWQIEYLQCEESGNFFYRVGSHSVAGWGIDRKEESAIDSTDGKYLWADRSCTVENDTSKKVLLTQKYGIKNIVNSGGCEQVDDIGFDYLGRPYNGIAQPLRPDFSNIMTENCDLTFMMTDETTFTIRISAETGHAFIVGQEDS